jgi:hypothetical protein
MDTQHFTNDVPGLPLRRAARQGTSDAVPQVRQPDALDPPAPDARRARRRRPRHPHATRPA